MVDLHHHLIYGIDDGAKSFEDMCQMMLHAASQGVTDIVCTSHVTPGIAPFPIDRYYAHLEGARAYLAGQGIPLRVYPGCEVLYTDAAARLLKDGQYPTLAYSDAVLVEFSPDASFQEMTDAAKNFGIAGYQVLFAHIERYEALRKGKNIQILRDEYQVNMQMNANTVITKKGFFEDRWVRKTLENGYIDCVATDAHNLHSRRCKMQECYEVLANRYDIDTAEELCGGFQRRFLGI